uniref:(northern house mosquito) hypothetical protein n=1 Tax=Culex pipiens TaxID=7175 RepID=A0A8D8ARG9_CULPI
MHSETDARASWWPPTLPHVGWVSVPVRVALVIAHRRTPRTVGGPAEVERARVLLPPSVRPSAACVLFSLCFCSNTCCKEEKNRCNQSSVTFQSLGYLFAPTKFCQSIVLRLAERSLPRLNSPSSLYTPARRRRPSVFVCG